MRIDISNISKIDGASMAVVNDGLTLEFPGLIDEMSVVKPQRFEGKLTNIGGMLRLEGKLRAQFGVKCHRCLKELDKKLDLHIEETIVNSRTNDDTEAYAYEGNFFEMDKVLIDNILLNLPMKHVCDENCKGLCPQCGANLNIAKCACKEDGLDSRMDVLKEFFNR